MAWLRVVVLRLMALFRKGRLEQEMDEELRSHLEMVIEENVRKGMSREEARYAALRSFGGVEQVKEAYREQRGLPMIETAIRDLRYGLRMLVRNRGFTTVAVLTLALGIGANTAIFSVLDELLLRTLPVEEPQQLVSFARDESRSHQTQISCPLYADLRDRNEVLSGLIALSGTSLILDVDGSKERIAGQVVSGNFFSVLGVKAALGRTFLPNDDRTPGAHPVAIVSYGLWQRRFGTDPGVPPPEWALVHCHRDYPCTIHGHYPWSEVGHLCSNDDAGAVVPFRGAQAFQPG